MRLNNAPKGAHYRQQLTCCGKGSCRACGGARYAHGPYWYAYWSHDGRTRSAYVGKELPAAALRDKDATFTELDDKPKRKRQRRR